MNMIFGISTNNWAMLVILFRKGKSNIEISIYFWSKLRTSNSWLRRCNCIRCSIPYMTIPRDQVWPNQRPTLTQVKARAKDDAAATPSSGPRSRRWSPRPGRCPGPRAAPAAARPPTAPWLPGCRCGSGSPGARGGRTLLWRRYWERNTVTAQSVRFITCAIAVC